MPPHYLLIPLIAIGVALAGSLITRSGLGWFRTLRLPAWMPSTRLITSVWTILFILASASAILAWNATAPRGQGELGALYLVNAFLNIAFSYLFFVRHQMGSATLEALLLSISIGVLMLQVFSASFVAALLLAPYLLWVLFSAALAFAVFRLNVKA